MPVSLKIYNLNYSARNQNEGGRWLGGQLLKGSWEMRERERERERERDAGCWFHNTAAVGSAWPALFWSSVTAGMPRRTHSTWAFLISRWRAYKTVFRDTPGSRGGGSSGKLKGPGLTDGNAAPADGPPLISAASLHWGGILVKGEAPERGELHDCCPISTINLDEHRLLSLNRRRCVECATPRSWASPRIWRHADAFHAEHHRGRILQLMGFFAFAFVCVCVWRELVRWSSSYIVQERCWSDLIRRPVSEFDRRVIGQQS